MGGGEREREREQAAQWSHTCSSPSCISFLCLVSEEGGGKGEGGRERERERWSMEPSYLQFTLLHFFSLLGKR